MKQYQIAVLEGDGIGPETVSYTHLDVYKRQVPLFIRISGAVKSSGYSHF